MANVDRLQAAGLLATPHLLTDDEEDKVNQLSPAEVDALVSVRSKLGDAFFGRKVPDGNGHRFGTLIL
jgi:hypothetical protein